MLRAARPLAVLLCLGCLGLVAACTGKDAVDTSSAGDYRFVTATQVGQVFPAADRKPVGSVTGTLINGGAFSLAADKGKVVIVNFWASWCAPCQIETPQLDALYREQNARGVDVVGVDTKENSRDSGTSFISDNHISYPMLWDEPGKTAIELGHVPADALPFTVIVDKQQRVAAVYLKAVTPGDLQPVLTALLAEQ